MRSNRSRLVWAVAVAAAAVAAFTAFTGTQVVAQVRAALVKNVDEPWRTPWETRSQFLPNAGGCFGTSDCYNYDEGSQFATMNVRPVPAGKRWVVQSAAGWLAGGYGRIQTIELGYPKGSLVFDGTKWAFGGPFAQSPSFNAATFGTSLNVTFGPGEAPFLRVIASPSLNGYVVIVFSGYLIDAN